MSDRPRSGTFAFRCGEKRSLCYRLVAELHGSLLIVSVGEACGVSDVSVCVFTDVYLAGSQQGRSGNPAFLRALSTSREAMVLSGTPTASGPGATGQGPGASLRTWRGGRPTGPGQSHASLRGDASFVDAASASTRGLRAVRLSRINPAAFPQMERLDEARTSCESAAEDSGFVVDACA
eukprot:s3099_g1.t1